VRRQAASAEWREQWTLFADGERFLFDEWIAPATLEDFRGKHVLEAGCGGGQHTALLASVAASVTAVDLATTEIARARNQGAVNVSFVEDDAGTMDLGRVFEAVVCVGVIHHTDDPDRTFENLYRHTAPGGLLVVWTYSAEGNALVRRVVEPARRLFLRRLPRRAVALLARALTAFLYPIVHGPYRLRGLRFLPYYDYFANFRRLSFDRNVLNVFDKLNAPQTHFTSEATCRRWMAEPRFERGSVSVRAYAGVSWSLVGRKRTS
jgi:SAM-dependent methyltransferase